MVLQPAYLDIATAKKKVIQIFEFFFGKDSEIVLFQAADDSADFGLVLERGPAPGLMAGSSGSSGSPHVVKEVRFGSAAHSAGRIEAGDEIVQVLMFLKIWKFGYMCQDFKKDFFLH